MLVAAIVVFFLTSVARQNRKCQELVNTVLTRHFKTGLDLLARGLKKLLPLVTTAASRRRFSWSSTTRGEGTSGLGELIALMPCSVSQGWPSFGPFSGHFGGFFWGGERFWPRKRPPTPLPVEMQANGKEKGKRGKEEKRKRGREEENGG